MTLILHVVNSYSGFTSTSTVELCVDPEDDNSYDKESFLYWYGNDDGHVRWVTAVPVLDLVDGFTSTSTMELDVDPKDPAPTSPDPTVPASPCRRLLTIVNFTGEYVNVYFGVKVKE